MSIARNLSYLVVSCVLGACAHHPPDEPADPLEPMNRAIFKFNDTADHYVLHPVAKGYQTVVPSIVRRGISNFFNNLAEPKTFVNDLLQAKFVQGGSDLGRFLLNSTAGLAGFIDVATSAGLQRHDEDFGQTLGFWGVGEGWFLMIPLLGPSDNRDAIGRVGDYFSSYGYYVPGRYDVESYSATGTDLISTRADLLSADSLMNSQFDKYLFIRTAYLQRRQAMVYDGNPPPEKYPEDEDSSEPTATAPTTTPKDSPATPLATPAEPPPPPAKP